MKLLSSLLVAWAFAGCASSPKPASAPPPPEPDCPTGAHAVDGRCVAIDPPCPPEHTLVAGKGCVLTNAPTVSAPPPPDAPAGRVRLSEDLAFEDVVAGAGPVMPQRARVVVRYVGKLEDGSIFDESRSEPPTFDVGKGHLIAGWEEGMPGMRVGGKRRLFVGPKKGYGARGAPPRIPPNAFLIFEIELLRIDPAEDRGPMTAPIQPKKSR